MLFLFGCFCCVGLFGILWFYAPDLWRVVVWFVWFWVYDWFGLRLLLVSVVMLAIFSCVRLDCLRLVLCFGRVVVFW